MNENRALEVELKGEIAEPAFGMPNGDGAVVIKLLPNTGDAENALLDPKAELVAGEERGAVFTEVEPEAAVKETIELKGLELEGAEPISEFAKLGKLPMFDFSGGIKFDLLAELCVGSDLLFPDWAHWFPDNVADSDDVTLDLSKEATELTPPNCGEKVNGVLLLPVLDLSCAAKKLAPPNFGEKLKGALLLPDGGAPADWEAVPKDIFEDVNELLGPVLEKVKLPPVELLCMLNGNVVSGAALN